MVDYEAMQLTPGDEIRNRIRRFQEYMNENGIDGALVLQKTDLYYFSGTVQSGCLYIPREGEPFFGVMKNLDRARRESMLERIESLKSPSKMAGLLKKRGYEVPKRLGLETDVVPAAFYLKILKYFNGSKTVDVSHGIRLIRSVKSAYELDIVHEASRKADQVCGRLKDVVEVGMTEIEAAGRIEAYARKLGHQGIVRMRLWGSELFYGHLMAGVSAAVPSYLASPTGGNGTSPAVAQGAGFRKIRRDEPILFDYTFAERGYLSDHTRIFCFGELSEKLIRAYEAMIQVQDYIMKESRPGVSSGDVYDAAVAKAHDLGYGAHFMGAEADRIRFVGHGIGLELDEYPFLAAGQTLPLEAGMTIAVEPKCIFPGEGVVGIENTHVLKSSGLERLTVFSEAIQYL